MTSGPLRNSHALALSRFRASLCKRNAVVLRSARDVTVDDTTNFIIFSNLINLTFRCNRVYLFSNSILDRISKQKINLMVVVVVNKGRGELIPRI